MPKWWGLDRSRIYQANFMRALSRSHRRWFTRVLYLHQPTIRKPSSRPLYHSLDVSLTRHRRLYSVISSLEFHSKGRALQPLRKLSPTSSLVKPLKPRRLAASLYCLGIGSFGVNRVPKASNVTSLRTCCLISLLLINE